MENRPNRRRPFRNRATPNISGVRAHQPSDEHTKLLLNIACLSPETCFGVGSGGERDRRRPSQTKQLPGCERKVAATRGLTPLRWQREPASGRVRTANAKAQGEN